ncbi:MAG TPA: P-loop NTPase [Gemmatimonadaceae bacterium]|nr:P-loop NTPase [Gemmatimonadaceae bacterium]
MENLQERIAGALVRVRNSRLGSDIVSAEQVRDVATTTDGRVRLTLLLDPADDAALVGEVRSAIAGIDGVRDVRVDVKDSSTAGAQPAGPKPAGSGRALPVMGQEPKSQRAAVPAPTPVAYPNLGHIVAVSSGKGGVGKSTVATNLAVALAQTGARVGLMDADIYGPNIPAMLGVNEQPDVQGEKIIPLEGHGVKVMSLGFLVERDQPAIWRGPIIMKIITQFLRDVAWGELDYFIVDLPPGTGDAQLSLVQATHVGGALIVTTPQEVSTGDALRGAKMFQRVGVPVLGIIENMSYFECAHCREQTMIFGAGGGERLARELGLPLLARIPLYPQVLQGGDTGRPIVVAEPDSVAGRTLLDLGRRLVDLVGSRDPAAV